MVTRVTKFLGNPWEFPVYKVFRLYHCQTNSNFIIMIKQIFYLKSDRSVNRNEYPIYLKLTYKGQSTTLSTGKCISKERWTSTYHLRAPLRVKEEKTCKLVLDRIEEELELIYINLHKSRKQLNVNDIKNYYLGKSIDEKDKDIISIFKVHNKNFKLKVKHGERSKASLQKYERAQSLIENFLNDKMNKKNYQAKNIDSSFVLKLEDYLKHESIYKGKIGIGHNSVVKYFKTFKTVCNYGIKMNLINENPFNCYEGKLKIKEAVFLTKKELERIENKKIDNERLNRVRDIFIFSTYTSYAPIDVHSLTTENLITDSSGCLWLKTNRAKTNIKSNVPVLSPVKRIIDKYAGLYGEKLLPPLSNQKMNAYLKEIADICGINKKLTHYVARHTFATTVTLGNGIAIENVSSMMGHTKLSTTQHYAKVLDQNVKNDMEKLNQKYK